MSSGGVYKTKSHVNKISSYYKEKPNLSNKRIIQKQLVYVIGLSASLANKEVVLYIL
jgi:hypothetical protein